MDEQQFLLGGHSRSGYSNTDDNEDSDEDAVWTGDEEDSSASASSSYYTETDSSDPEWETYIEENGQLLFIDCHPFVTQTSNETSEARNNTTLTKNHMRKSTRSKFLRLIRRRDSKRRSKRQAKNEQQVENKVKFQDYNEGEVKIVVLHVHAPPKFTQRTKLAENLLGISVSTFSDGSRLMVAGIMPCGPAKGDKSIKIGDWLKSVNDINVNASNFTQILEQFEGEFDVKLELQRVTGIEVTKPVSEISNQSMFVKQLTTISSNENLQLLLIEQPIGILYMDTECLTETGGEFQGVIYCYPNPLEKNRLCANRGVFITLNHLIHDVTSTQPTSTSALICGRLAHVAYNSIENKLLLLMLPDNRLTRGEVMHLHAEIQRTLKFVYGSLNFCFEDTTHRVEVDHFFSRFFARILTSGLWSKAEQSVVLSSLPSKALVEAPYQFEWLVQSAHMIHLPSEAKMQIDDALSELEACDYREWNEDPLDCQRLFTILGSALYHSGYLLSSHLIYEDLIDVHVYCRQQGLFHLSQAEPVRSMVLWREVYPYSCNREGTNFVIPDGAKHYLLVVGSGKDLLAVIMEAGGCTEPAEENLPPDAFYVEEAQATLAHLQELGISELAARWLRTNPGNQVTIPQIPIAKQKNDGFLANFKAPSLPTVVTSASTASNSSTLATGSKRTDITSILKRRSNDQLATTQSSLMLFENDDAQSEDSIGNASERSEVSDEPILGRRAQRDRYRFSDEEESDIEDYRDGSQLSQSSYDVSELRNNLLAQAGDSQPMSIGTGNDFMLYHYVHFDSTEGILLSPPDCTIESKTLDLILNSFRRAVLQMHELFKNTIRFKVMNSEEMTKSVMNKSLVAVKEHGVLFEVPFQEENANKKCLPLISYWVIGRLFYMPHPRELYVCYKDDIPQNMVEIAFKLGISTAM